MGNSQQPHYKFVQWLHWARISYSGGLAITRFSRKGVNRKPSHRHNNDKHNLFSEAQQYAYRPYAVRQMASGRILSKVNGLRTAQLAAVQDYLSTADVENVETKKYAVALGDTIYITPKTVLKIG